MYLGSFVPSESGAVSKNLHPFSLDDRERSDRLKDPKRLLSKHAKPVDPIDPIDLMGMIGMMGMMGQ